MSIEEKAFWSQLNKKLLATLTGPQASSSTHSMAPLLEFELHQHESSVNAAIEDPNGCDIVDFGHAAKRLEMLLTIENSPMSEQSERELALRVGAVIALDESITFRINDERNSSQFHDAATSRKRSAQGIKNSTYRFFYLNTLIEEQQSALQKSIILGAEAFKKRALSDVASILSAAKRRRRKIDRLVQLREKWLQPDEAGAR